MSMKEINSYELPVWMQRCWDDIVNESFHKLTMESEQYKELYENCNQMTDKHKYIAEIVDGDSQRYPVKLEPEETKLLSKYLQMLSDQQELEQMQIYLLGCRDMYRVLRLLEIVE